MAVTKIWTIKDSLQRVLDYAANPDKTEYDALAQTLHYAENDAKTKLSESAQLVTGIHCRPDHAWEDMRAVQERFGKTDGVVALHAYQSFREGEVTPEQCHEIGVALARKVWGKRFQVLVATHMNTDNLHNHFVINSVSYVDGKKYEQRRSQYSPGVGMPRLNSSLVMAAAPMPVAASWKMSCTTTAVSGFGSILPSALLRYPYGQILL